uniref:SAM domain-containing protein n=1 Tax=Angiostrongylus cantonensis TaxID=6313 RepID=A0A0K0CXZ5_ANGCA
MMETPTMAPAPAPQPPPPSTSTAFSKSNQLRKSCPDLETATALPPSSDNRGQRRRNRRAKEKMKEACWRRKPVEDWALDDVLLWLQACNLDDVASLLIGYDLRGKDLLLWDHHCLSQLGVTSASIREKILSELATIRERGPEDVKEIEKKTGHRALFDIVRQSSYDQVLAVETPLTNRDIVVTHGRLGCLQITKVNGVNLPLRENDCLLEINDCPGEQFKSALMLTKLISDANGAPIRFVVLRMKTIDRLEDGSVSNEASSSGVSSSPRSPSD